MPVSREKIRIDMLVGILRESGTEKRVVMLPSEAAVLKKMVAGVLVEHNAGESAYLKDHEYVASGASVVGRDEVLSRSRLILSINPVGEYELSSLKEGTILCSILNPALNFGWLDRARNLGLTIIGLDLVPRITRAQSMDILSSMATVAGYKAVLAAASLLPRFFPMFMSAAGTIKPARVLILGAGVAGLQAVAISRKLGAVVEVFDVRSAVGEEVRSLGAKFIEVEGSKEDSSAGGYAIQQTDEYKKRQAELIHKHAVVSDVVITTAQIPGKKAPLLLPRETVMAMKQGSVIVDLAASSGGNCELTENNKTVTVNGITITGRSDFASEMPSDASRLFGSNVINLLKIFIDNSGEADPEKKDEIINYAVAVHKREFISPALKQMFNIK